MMSLRLNFTDLATIAIQGLIACFLAFSLTSVAWAAEKLNLVLLPIEVSQSERAYEDEYGSAVQKGLAQHYTVFYGADVERQLQKEYSKLDCTAESCNQNVAIAFNGELIADASVTKVSGGYLLKLVITNVLTNEVVLSETNACRGCDLFDVIPALENLISNPLGTSGQLGQTTAPTVAQSAARAILIFDTEPSGATVFAADKMMGTTPYQGLDFKVGDILQFDIRKDGYDRLPLQVELKTPITQLETLALSPSLGKVTLTIDPFQNATDIYINDQKVGVAPVMLELGVGYYTGFATNADRTSKETAILVSAHSDQVITFTLPDKLETANLATTQSNSDEDLIEVVLAFKPPSAQGVISSNVVDNASEIVIGDESTTFSTPESSDNENYEVAASKRYLKINAGRIVSNPFDVKDWDCVIDQDTNLMWQTMITTDSASPITLAEAERLIVKANAKSFFKKPLCGFSGWRIPTASEFRKSIACPYSGNALPTQFTEGCNTANQNAVRELFFPHTVPKPYWVMQDSQNNEPAALNLNSAEIIPPNFVASGAKFHIQLVRNHAVNINDHNCVFDSTNPALVWDKLNGNTHKKHQVYDWWEAKALAKEINSSEQWGISGYCGLRSWRVPTYSELKSLLDKPDLLGQINIAKDTYHTSSNDAGFINFGDHTYYKMGIKSNTFHIILVADIE